MLNLKSGGGGFVSNREWHNSPKAQTRLGHIAYTPTHEPKAVKAIAYTGTMHAQPAVPVYYKTRRATHRLPAGSWVPLVSKPNYCRRVTP